LQLQLQLQLRPQLAGDAQPLQRRSAAAAEQLRRKQQE
jgi:hypothetical protein